MAQIISRLLFIFKDEMQAGSSKMGTEPSPVEETEGPPPPKQPERVSGRICWSAFIGLDCRGPGQTNRDMQVNGGHQ